jgi:hypothetical protein
MLLSLRLWSSALYWLSDDVGVLRPLSSSRSIGNEDTRLVTPARSFGLTNAPRAPDCKKPRLFIFFFLNLRERSPSVIPQAYNALTRPTFLDLPCAHDSLAFFYKKPPGSAGCFSTYHMAARQEDLQSIND